MRQLPVRLLPWVNGYSGCLGVIVFRLDRTPGYNQAFSRILLIVYCESAYEGVMLLTFLVISDYKMNILSAVRTIVRKSAQQLHGRKTIRQTHKQ